MGFSIFRFDKLKGLPKAELDMLFGEWELESEFGLRVLEYFNELILQAMLVTLVASGNLCLALEYIL